LKKEEEEMDQKKKGKSKDFVSTYLFMDSVLVVLVRLDFGSLFAVLILNLGMLVAVHLAADRHRLCRTYWLGLS
jgi:hypothetical protein